MASSPAVGSAEITTAAQSRLAHKQSIMRAVGRMYDWKFMDRFSFCVLTEKGLTKHRNIIQSENFFRGNFEKPIAKIRKTEYDNSINDR
jgi:hypothetical protein